MSSYAGGPSRCCCCCFLFFWPLNVFILHPFSKSFSPSPPGVLSNPWAGRRCRTKLVWSCEPEGGVILSQAWRTRQRCTWSCWLGCLLVSLGENPLFKVVIPLWRSDPARAGWTLTGSAWISRPLVEFQRLRSWVVDGRGYWMGPKWATKSDQAIVLQLS